MHNKTQSRNGVIHLYDPKKEGLGSYDVHYINARKKNKIMKISNEENENERYVA